MSENKIIWRTMARQRLQEVWDDLPKDATPTEVKKVIRESYPFGERDNWPYKVWLDESKKWFYDRFPDLMPDEMKAGTISETERLEKMGQQRLPL